MQILIRIDCRLLRVLPICCVAKCRILSLLPLWIHLEALVAGAVRECGVWCILCLGIARHTQYISASLRMSIDGQSVRMVRGNN